MHRLAIAFLLVVAACACTPGAGTDQDQGPRPSASVSQLSGTPSTTPHGATTASLRACAAEDVKGTFDQWGAAAGSYGISFRLAPTSDDTCVLPDHPVATFIDERGSRLSFVEPWPGAVRLVPVRAAAGKDATFFLLLWSNHGADAGYVCASQTLRLAAVQIDAASGPITLEFPVAGRPTLCTDPPERVFGQVVARDP